MGSDEHFPALGKVVLTLFLLCGSARAADFFDIDGLRLGAGEAEVKRHYPHANCRDLEWTSKAADRRCDDSRIKFGGIDASVTFYLKRDAVEGFDVRFDKRQLEPITKFLRQRYGEPSAHDAASGRLEWKNKAERARLHAEPENRRASLLVGRGDFERQLYKIP